MDFSVGLISFVAGVIMTLCGVNAYRGRWRTWLQPGLIPRVDSYVGLGLLFGGIGFALAPLAALLADVNAPRPLTVVAVGMTMTGILLWLLSTAWLPRFMRPAWVRAEQDAPSRPPGSDDRP
ncbi:MULTISPECIES: hypothetical protein [unclassified Arthrobacter]|uniref:hypothetical protein n=1 Tax=unclassified Arthrobacter TaxID=235627 RepID=UPI0014926A24|nr:MULTISPECIES: hypothetical protein [unclassified Arthrobacter]NOJ62670.1 hypothetical protein [Arthrobacter sp. 147(2020)]